MMTAQEELTKLRPELRYFRIHFPQIQKARLAQKNRADKLEQENKALQVELEKSKVRERKLIEELEKIKRQRDKYKGMIFKPNIEKSSGQHNFRKKKLGGQLNHKGAARFLPPRVDQVSRVYFHHCPNCGNPLGRTDSLDTHTVEDIPDFLKIKTTATRFEMERQWCGSCGKEVTANPPGVIPHSRLGINLITAMLFPNVPLDNNPAERGIRPAVIVRKISGGSRSDIGAETFAINMSVIQTLKMRNQPLIPTLHKLLLNGVSGKY